MKSSASILLERLNILTLNAKEEFSKFYTSQWRKKVEKVFAKLQHDAKNIKNTEMVYGNLWKRLNAIPEFKEHNVTLHLTLKEEGKDTWTFILASHHIDTDEIDMSIQMSYPIRKLAKNTTDAHIQFVGALYHEYTHLLQYIDIQGGGKIKYLQRGFRRNKGRFFGLHDKYYNAHTEISAYANESLYYALAGQHKLWMNTLYTFYASAPREAYRKYTTMFLYLLKDHDPKLTVMVHEYMRYVEKP